MRAILILVAALFGTNASAQFENVSELEFIADATYILTCADKSSYMQELTAKYGPGIVDMLSYSPEFKPEKYREQSQMLLSGTKEQVSEMIQKEMELSNGFDSIVFAILCTAPELKAKEINTSCINDKTGKQMSTNTLLKVCQDLKPY